MAMFIERLLNQGNAPMLERVVQFTQARHRLLAENIVNIDTPGYQQSDLSIEKFQQMLADRVDDRRRGEMSGFDDIETEIERPTRGILSHDGNNRSMEQLMTDQTKNALMHNLAIELLRKQYGALTSALQERVT
jgi:flagellar basal-body rod protein FlgB